MSHPEEKVELTQLGLKNKVEFDLK